MLNLFKLGIFEADHGWGWGKKPPLHLLLKICHPRSKMMKLDSYILPKKDTKTI